MTLTLIGGFCDLQNVSTASWKLSGASVRITHWRRENPNVYTNYEKTTLMIDIEGTWSTLQVIYW